MAEENKRPNISDKEIINTEQTNVPGVRALPSSLAGSSYQDLIRNDRDDGVDDGRQLQSPRNISIVSQTIKFNADGTQFVDVVVEFDVVDGAQNYEVRLSKQ